MPGSRAEIVQNEEFRTAPRDFLHRTFGAEQGRLMTSPEMAARVERHRKLLLEARAAQLAGMPADSPGARDIAERVAADSADSRSGAGAGSDADRAAAVRAWMAAALRQAHPQP